MFYKRYILNILEQKLQGKIKLLRYVMNIINKLSQYALTFISIKQL